MARFELVLQDIGRKGVRVTQSASTIDLMFPPHISHENLVGLTADILMSEGLPHQGNYSTMTVRDGVLLRIFRN